jgi:hypothetical protein
MLGSKKEDIVILFFSQFVKGIPWKDFYELRATIRAGSIEGIEVLVTNLFASIIQRGDKNLDAYCDNNKNFEWWITKI